MKVYEFEIKKTIKLEVQIKDKNYNEALKILITILGDEQNSIMELAPEKEKFYELKLTNVLNDFDPKDEMILIEEDNEINEEDEEIKDDLPREYTQIVCEKCGNCIPLEDDFMS